MRAWSLCSLLALPLLGQQGVNFYSIEKERALGESLAREVRVNSKPFQNALVADYVKHVGAQIVGQLPEKAFEYSFEVISSDDPEPIALPGGHVFVPAKFLLAVQHEAEFADMLGHAVAHIALRHGTRNATRAQIVNATSIPLIFMGGWQGSHAAARANTAVLIPAGFLPYQRKAELEADRVGVELAARVGYNAAAFRAYIERVQNAVFDPVRSALPRLEERLAGLDEVIQKHPGPLPASSVAFTRAQEAVRQTLVQPEKRPPTLRRQ